MDDKNSDLQRLVPFRPFPGLRGIPQEELYAVVASYVQAEYALGNLSAPKEAYPPCALLETQFKKETKPEPCLFQRSLVNDPPVRPSFNYFKQKEHVPNDHLGTQRKRGEPSSRDDKQKQYALSDLLSFQKKALQNEGILTSFKALSANIEYQNDAASLPTSSSNKEFHNLRERFRRKKLKNLYSDLRELLPDPNPKKRLSVPKTVCRVLKYIPELRNELEKLKRQRDELLAATHSTEVALKKDNLSSELRPFVTVCPVFGHSDLLVKILGFKDLGLRFSAIIAELEASGLDLVQSSSFSSERIVYHSIHLEIKASGATKNIYRLRERLLKLVEIFSTKKNRQLS